MESMEILEGRSAYRSSVCIAYYYNRWVTSIHMQAVKTSQRTSSITTLSSAVHWATVWYCFVVPWLPACELDSQYEQDAEQDSPTDKIRSPGHQKQHLPKRLPQPAQHYRFLALPPIYTRQVVRNKSIIVTGWEGRLGDILSCYPGLDIAAVNGIGFPTRIDQPSLPTYTYNFRSAGARESRLL